MLKILILILCLNSIFILILIFYYIIKMLINLLYDLGDVSTELLCHFFQKERKKKKTVNYYTYLYCI